MDALSAKCLINNNMHLAAQGLQKMILDKEALKIEGDQLVEHFLAQEAWLAHMGELKA